MLLKRRRSCASRNWLRPVYSEALEFRRDFLKSIIAMALPIPLAEATDQQVDAAWQELSRNPSCSVFAVDEYRTLSCPWEEYPSYRHEVFDVNTHVRSRQALLREIEACAALASHFEVEFDVAHHAGDPLATRLWKQNKGWSDWILRGSLAEHRQRVEAWLADAVDTEELPLSAGPVGAAYAYFQCAEYATLDRLGVVVIEGEPPGSSYFAAELRVPIAEANTRAAAHGIPIRFVAA
jgi:hypothetical protein